MLLQMGPLLRLGPKVITDGTFITLGSIYYTCAFYTLLHQSCHTELFLTQLKTALDHKTEKVKF